MPRDEVEVAVVGGGLAGAAVASRLARLGHEVLVLERSERWRWRAGGVFSSPASRRELADLGLDVEAAGRVACPIPAMRVETPGGTTFRLTYGADTPGAPVAIGFDRSRLDPWLLHVAKAAGARVERGAEVRQVRTDDRGPTKLVVRDPAGERSILARVVVGADGPRSVVARAMGVVQRPWLAGRVGLSWHVAQATAGPGGAASAPREARMVVLPDGAYCGLAPVTGDRVNVGIVLWGARHRARLARQGAAPAAAHVLAAVPLTPGGPNVRPDAPPLDARAGASPLGVRVARRAGPGWLLVGDAAGFLDPFTGEGIHRALVSARLAAGVVDAALRGPAGSARRPPDLTAYERAMRARFASKDVVSLLVQGFLARPWLLEHAARRIASREPIRGTMGLVMADLVPASRALDPRFLVALLR